MPLARNVVVASSVLVASVMGVQAQPVAPTPAKKVICVSIAEQQQWKHVRDALCKDMKISQTKVQRVGEIIGHNQVVARIVNGAGVVGSAVGGCCLMVGIDALTKKISGKGMSGWKEDLIGISVISACVYLGECILNNLGPWLERKPALCMHALTSFVKEWSKHKTHTPEVLHPIFEALSQNCSKNGELKLTPQEAQKVVESLVAASMLTEVAVA
jgi:hypothetical protein